MDDLRSLSNHSVSDNEIFWDWVSKEFDVKGSDENAYLRFSPKRNINKEFKVIINKNINTESNFGESEPQA